MSRPNIADVVRALTPLAAITRPEGDNEGDPINGDTVYPHLTDDEQEQVSDAEDIVRNYVRTADQQADVRAINTLKRHGFYVSFGPTQYPDDDGFDRLVGSVRCGEWMLDISDPHNSPHY